MLDHFGIVLTVSLKENRSYTRVYRGDRKNEVEIRLSGERLINLSTVSQLLQLSLCVMARLRGQKHFFL